MLNLEVTDLGVRYTDAQGRVFEMVGEQYSGEWFASDADGECFAQGFYENDQEGEGTFFQDDYSLDMNTDLPVEDDQLEEFIQGILEGAFEAGQE